MLADRLGEMRPFQPGGPLRMPRRPAQPAWRESLAQHLRDRPAFEQRPPVQLQRRHPPRRAERQERRIAQRPAERMLHHLERRAQLVQQPQGPHRTRLGAVVQADHHISCGPRAVMAQVGGRPHC